LMGTQPKLLVTGASGIIATAIRPSLLARFGSVRLLDQREITNLQAGEEPVVADIRSIDAMERAMQGIDCVIHLAGIAKDDTWPTLRDTNIDGVYALFEAARRSKLRRVVFASSHHTVAFTPLGETVSIDSELRPSGLYGVTKAFGEAIGRLYSLKHGIEVVCLRIGAFQPAPQDHRQLFLWLSPRDMAQLAICSVEAHDISYLKVFGISANSRNPYDRAGWDALGYAPQDNAENFLGSAANLMGHPTLASDRFCGGEACLRGPVGT
jgi:uronate dehydrogenase